MKKLLLSVGLLVTAALSAQNFSKTFFHTDLDMNHMNIEAIHSIKQYVVGGTTFEIKNNNKTNMYISVTDLNGNIVWQRESPSYWEESRLLDIAVDDNNDIIAVGYSRPDFSNIEMLTVVKFDINGNLLGTYLLDQATRLGSVSAGTNIIYSPANDEYVIGGFFADSMSYPLNTNNEALLMVLDKTLTHSWLTTLSGADNSGSSINDIIEVPTGYFVTGSIDYPNASTSTITQAVLACYLAPGGSILNTLSFHNSNEYHRGVSAVYDALSNDVFVISTSSITHNPVLTRISLPSAIPPAILNNHLIKIDVVAGEYDPAVFQMIASPTNTENLVIAGYTRAPINNTATTWMAEIDKNTAIVATARIYDAPTGAFITNHGGGLLSTFQTQDPYIFNQEIITRKADLSDPGVAFIAPRETTQPFGGNFNFDIATANLNIPSLDVSCMTEIARLTEGFSVSPVSTEGSSYTPVEFEEVPESFDFANLNQHSFCSYVPSGGQRKKSTQTGIAETVQLSVAPNPSNGLMKLQLNGENFQTISIYNSIGKLVKTIAVNNENQNVIDIDLSAEANGIYILTANGVNSQETIRISKQD